MGHYMEKDESADAKGLTTEFTEERIRAARGINIIKKNKLLCELFFLKLSVLCGSYFFAKDTKE